MTPTWFDIPPSGEHWFIPNGEGRYSSVCATYELDSRGTLYPRDVQAEPWEEACERCVVAWRAAGEGA
jgi:hypothetical protein